MHLEMLSANVRHFVQASMCWLIETEWHIYVSVQHTYIGSDNGLSPVQCQAIIWTIAAIWVNLTPKVHFSVKL